jgi:hypothetical protein
LFDYTAIGSGYFKVIVNDAEVSRHVTEREALERANAEELANPDADVKVRHDYEVDVDLTAASVDTFVGVPVRFTLRASDPAAVSISGEIVVTPLVENANVSLVPEVL